MGEGGKEERDVFEEEWYETVSMKLWQVITHSTDGEARKMADNSEQSGIIGWRNLVTHYDPRQGIDMSSDMSRIVYPREHFGRAKDVGQAKILLNEYQQEVKRYNNKYPFDAINPEWL